MALDGGGGGGGPIGSSNSFTGSASLFELIGKHVYALNNGTSAGQNTEFTILEATTGNYYSVGKLRFAINSDSTNKFQHQIYFNGLVVYGEVLTEHTGDQQPINILIPPYTEVKFTSTNISSGDAIQVFINYVGRTYR